MFLFLASPCSGRAWAQEAGSDRTRSQLEETLALLFLGFVETPWLKIGPFGHGTALGWHEGRQIPPPHHLPGIRGSARGGGSVKVAG